MSEWSGQSHSVVMYSLLKCVLCYSEYCTVPSVYLFHTPVHWSCYVHHRARVTDRFLFIKYLLHESMFHIGVLDFSEPCISKHISSFYIKLLSTELQLGLHIKCELNFQDNILFRLYIFFYWTPCNSDVTHSSVGWLNLSIMNTYHALCAP